MKVNKTPRNVFAGLTVAAILGTTGCSAVNPAATTFAYAPSDGTQTSVAADGVETEGFVGTGADHVDFLNIAVVSDATDESGLLIGAIHNKSDTSQDVELQINDESFAFSLDAQEIYSLEGQDHALDTVGTEPGALADGVGSAFGNSSEFNVPVLPPTLEHYREIYPDDIDVDEQTEHLYDFQGQHVEDDE